MKKLKVLFVAHDCGVGGAQNILLRILENFLESGLIDIHLVVPENGQFTEGLASQGVKYSILNFYSWLPWIRFHSRYHLFKYRVKFFFSSIIYAFRFYFLYRAVRPDLIFVNTVVPFQAVVLGRLIGVPVVWSIHEKVFTNFDLTKVFDFWVYRFFLSKFSGVLLFPSSSLRLSNDFLAFSGSSEVVPLGVAIPIKNLDYLHRIRYKENNRPFRIAIIGSYLPNKDHNLFLQIAKEISLSNDNVVFDLVGAGSEKQLTDLKVFSSSLGLSSRVSFFQLSSSSIFDYLLTVDILFITSFYESFGLTAIEAGAAAVPVISTRCGGPEEVILDGVTGFLLDFRDPIMAAGLALKLLNDGGKRRRMGDAAYENISLNYNISVYSRKLYSIFNASVKQ